MVTLVIHSLQLKQEQRITTLICGIQVQRLIILLLSGLVVMKTFLRHHGSNKNCHPMSLKNVMAYSSSPREASN